MVRGPRAITHIKEIPIAIPPLEEQSAIVEAIDERLGATEVMENGSDSSLKRTERLRQSVLKKAFSGRLVPQAAKGDIVSIQAFSSGSSSDE